MCADLELWDTAISPAKRTRIVLCSCCHPVCLVGVCDSTMRRRSRSPCTPHAERWQPLQWQPVGLAPVDVKYGRRLSSEMHEVAGTEWWTCRANEDASSTSIEVVLLRPWRVGEERFKISKNMYEPPTDFPGFDQERQYHPDYRILVHCQVEVQVSRWVRVEHLQRDSSTKDERFVAGWRISCCALYVCLILVRQWLASKQCTVHLPLCLHAVSNAGSPKLRNFYHDSLGVRSKTCDADSMYGSFGGVLKHLRSMLVSGAAASRVEQDTSAAP